MSVAPEQDITKEAGSIKMFQAMVGIGFVCALLIVVAFQVTLPVINQNKAEALEKAVFKVVPNATQQKAFRWTGDNFEAFKGQASPSAGDLVYAAYNAQDSLLGVAVTGSGQGFQDIIQLIYGYNPYTQKLIGFQILESRETPGLGDKTSSDTGFLSNFDALDVQLDSDHQQILHPVVAVKHGTKQADWQIDSITGATISSKAVGSIINKSTLHWMPIIFNHSNEFEMDNHGSAN